MSTILILGLVLAVLNLLLAVFIVVDSALRRLRSRPTMAEAALIGEREPVLVEPLPEPALVEAVLAESEPVEHQPEPEPAEDLIVFAFDQDPSFTAASAQLARNRARSNRALIRARGAHVVSPVLDSVS